MSICYFNLPADVIVMVPEGIHAITWGREFGIGKSKQENGE